MRPLGAARRGAKACRGPKNGPLALKPRIHASPESSPFPPHAQARSEFCVFSLYLRAQGTRWALPGAGQMRAAGPKMARSPSNHVYTHRRNFLHFYRMRELDLNYFIFARYAHPRCRPARGKSAPRAQKWPARPQTTYTRIAGIFTISTACALDLNYFVFAPSVPHGAGQKRAAGPKMARSSSNYVYTHCPKCLHLCRKRERDLNYFVFARYAHPGCRRARGKSGPRSRKRYARPQNAFSIAAVHTCEFDLTHFVLVLGIMDVQPCTCMYICTSVQPVSTPLQPPLPPPPPHRRLTAYTHTACITFYTSSNLGSMEMLARCGMELILKL
jgi:hypothetical protein